MTARICCYAMRSSVTLSNWAFTVLLLAIALSVVQGLEDYPDYDTKGLPDPRMYVDPFPPFYLGVSSGDPHPESVILWTRATPRGQAEIDSGVDVSWRVWSSEVGASSEEAPLAQGIELASPGRDYTVKVEAFLPEPNTTYFYRFYYGARASDSSGIGGEASRLGRTRTAPARDVNQGLLSLAYTSCSHQGWYLSGFAHLGYNMTLGGQISNPQLRGKEYSEEKLLASESMSAVLHTGDWMYDYNAGPRMIRQWGDNVGPAVYISDKSSQEYDDELIAAAYDPLPLGSEFDERWLANQTFYSMSFFPLELDEWRWRHITARLDPDRRAAAAAHPWIHIPDNHDGGPHGQSNASATSLQAFEWYSPTRVRYEAHPLSGEQQMVWYRQLAFGQLANMVIMDGRAIGRMQPEGTFFGSPQRSWLVDDVLQNPNNTQTWRIMVLSKSVTAWDITGYDTVAIGLTFGVALGIALGMTCCAFSNQAVRRAKVQALDASANDVSVSSQQGQQLEEEEEEEEDSLRTSGLETGIADHGSSETSKVLGDGEDEQPSEKCSTKLVRVRAGCVACCGSRGCGACGFLGFVLIIVISVLCSKILDKANSSDRLVYYPETEAYSVFGETIKLIGSPIDRAELFKDMHDNGATEDNLWLVGDMHQHQAANVRIDDLGHRIVPDEVKKAKDQGRNIFDDYDNIPNPKLGVEWLPSSTSSNGALDEFLLLTPKRAIAEAITSVYSALMMHFNKHWTYFDPASHGMGYVHIDATQATMEYYKADIYFPDQPAIFDWRGTVRKGDNEWSSMENIKP